MIANKVIFTRYTGDPHYRTPKNVYAQLDKEFHFTLDPAPFESKTKNGLKKRWNGRVFVNPPYSDSTQWVEKAISERNENYRCKLVVMLSVL